MTAAIAPSPADLRACADALNDEVTEPDAPTPRSLDEVNSTDDLIRWTVALLNDAADQVSPLIQGPLVDDAVRAFKAMNPMRWPCTCVGCLVTIRAIHRQLAEGAPAPPTPGAADAQ